MKPPELRELDPSRVLDLDVRADLRAGREPFQRIMHARQALSHDGVLRLRAIFEPRPLYAVLGREGFRHWTEELGPEDWRIWFWRDEVDAPTPEPEAGGDRPCGCSGPPSPTTLEAAAVATPTPACGSTDREGPADVRTLDVRGLEPPEPMVRTLAAIEELPPGETLVQVNVRVPRFLLPELEARGYQWQLLEDSGERVRMAIRHAGDEPVLDVRLLPSPRKHPTIFDAFDGLAPGEAFVLLNDHDPVPLRYQLAAERPDAFTWAYLEEGPVSWRVRIGRTA